MPTTIIKRGGYTRQRRGCLTCRQRKKRCDQGFPICGHCSRLNFVCKREEPRDMKAAPSTAMGIPGGTRVPDSSPCPSPEKEIVRIAQLCRPLDSPFSSMCDKMGPADIVAKNNCFLSALRSKEFEEVALQHRGIALAQLKASMAVSELSPEMCLAVTMVLCSMESISDPTDAWYYHLAGAAATLLGNDAPLFSSKGTQVVGLPSSEGKWLLRNFAYHDVLMSVSLDCRPFLVGDYWVSDDNSVADPYFGFASRILFLISETSVLNADFAGVSQSSASQDMVIKDVAARPDSDGQGGGISDSRFSERARAIESDTLQWTCPSASDSPLGQLGETYRHAALIHLYRTILRHVPDYSEVLKSKIQTSVLAICDLTSRMPEGCLAECTLVFPLFMAGGEAHETCQTEKIRGKLDVISKWRRFRNIEACLSVLEEVWRLRALGSRSGGHGRVDWLDVVKRRGWKLALS
ncbi:hypothetical protein CPLU01_03550 [Colletotrichum plurivorum]|uniref:Zn(2)-C6 fungal-type domain-containing protein n=1 Tax=Colletotrichum plurivorum TaxID=2175906 RepID=A0A8H6KTP5_9PEZI|nr:hypothetical protein CPLU01_03550 [Colletotrichum plurivorum]